MDRTVKLGISSLAILFTLFAVLAWYFFKDTSRGTVVEEGSKVSLVEMALQDEQGHSTKIDSHEKPIFLSFWATWCGPCLKEIPRILASHLSDRARLVFINLDSGTFLDRKKAVESWKSENKLSISTLFDSQGKLTDLFGISEIPLNALVGRNERVLWIHSGELSDKNLAQVISTLPDR